MILSTINCQIKKWTYFRFLILYYEITLPLNNEKMTIIMSEHNSERINLQITKHRFLNLQTHHTKSGAIHLGRLRRP